MRAFMAVSLGRCAPLTILMGRPGGLPTSSLSRTEVRPAIPLIAALIGVRALRALLTVADRFQLVGWHAQTHQEVLGGAGAAIAQAQVVLGRSALIAVSLDHDRRVREIGQDRLDRRGVARQHVARVGPNVALVV